MPLLCLFHAVYTKLIRTEELYFIVEIPLIPNERRNRSDYA